MAFDTDDGTFTSDHKDVYTEAEDGVDTARADSTDEVDVSKLVRDANLDDIRWVYRNTFASVLVDKPIDDAFKHGIEIKSDPTGQVRKALDSTNYLDAYKRAEKKARRDGFALVFFVLNDSTDGPHVKPTRDNTTDIEKAKVLKVDDLGSPAPGSIADQVDGYDADEIEVRETGIVVSRRRGDVKYGDPLGYVREFDADGSRKPHYQFLHRKRCQHLVWNETVDGDYKGLNAHGEEPLGRWEGNSILTSSYHYIKDSFKGTWAIMQTLFRYSSPLYELSLPERIDDDELVDQMREDWQNLNAKSEAIIPGDFELDMHTTDGQLDPESYFDAVFDQICASNEMNKTVLFGNQSGIVSGSESDAKNYFNQVARNQHGRHEEYIRDFIERVFVWRPKMVSSFALGFEIEWPPLFKLNEMDRVEKVRTVVNALQMASEQFYITPDEGREIFAEAVAEDFDVELDDDLSAEDFEMLQNLQASQVGSNKEETSGTNAQGNPRKQAKGSGMQKGQKTASENPTSDDFSINW